MNQRSSTLLELVVLRPYEICYRILVPFLHIFSSFSPRLKRQLKNRSVDLETINQIKAERKKFSQAVIFHCSSAGEYEQAKPIIDRLLKSNDIYVHIFFLSYSGLEFAHIKKEKAYTSICPHDLLHNWQQLFLAINPNISIVVRYELWPNFLYRARQHGALWLINYNKKSASIFTKFLHKIFLNLFDRIYSSSTEIYKSEGTKYINSSDTKFDRAYEIFLGKRKKHSHVKNDFKSFTSLMTLVGGSVWLPDITELLSAYNSLSPALQSKTNMILAPHDLSAKNIEQIESEIRRFKLPYQVYTATGQQILEDTKVVIVNSMGLLSELYSYGSLAFIGGAFHHKVHNTLEAAAFNIPIAFGPRFHSQAEAEQLICKGLAVSVSNSLELSNWWINIVEKDKQVIDTVNSNLEGFCGAADSIYSDIQEILCKKR